MTVLSDIERREKKEVMGKLHEMEKELKVRLNKYIDHSAYYCYSTVNKDDSIPINIHWHWSNYYLSPFHADLWQINRVIYLIYFQLLAKSESMTDQVN